MFIQLCLACCCLEDFLGKPIYHFLHMDRETSFVPFLQRQSRPLYKRERIRGSQRSFPLCTCVCLDGAGDGLVRRGGRKELRHFLVSISEKCWKKSLEVLKEKKVLKEKSYVFCNMTHKPLLCTYQNQGGFQYLSNRILWFSLKRIPLNDRIRAIVGNLCTSSAFFFVCLFVFKGFYLFIYLIYGLVGSSSLCEGLLQLRQVGANLHRGARDSHYRGLSCCGAQTPDAQAQ